ncbi:MAG TPA: glycosyltransferase family 39 protein, partial [Steroidobacteraceae bacterium]|nr:glycosyltransferase family 39 protein [Steroidobacteraceae bacterium]
MSLPLGQGLRGSGLGLLAWIVLALAWFATLQVRPLLDPDEGRYAEIPREMVASGDWVTPRFDDLKYFEKPPLQYWATALAYEAFGVHEWSARLWSVGLAFACLPLIFAWVRRLYGRGSALVALTALAVSPFFVIVAHINL